MLKNLVSEFIGTFMLVFVAVTVSFTNAGSSIIAFAIGGILAIMIYALGQVSGAHFNPAVSLGVFIRGKLSKGDLLNYIASQIAGGFVGFLVASLIVSSASGFVMRPAIVPASVTPLYIAMLAELIFTFALVTAVLFTATSPKNSGNSFFGAAIGGIVFVGILTVGSISGAVFNPAVALASHLANITSIGNNISALSIAYLLPQVLGGALAAYSYKFLLPSEETVSA